MAFKFYSTFILLILSLSSGHAQQLHHKIEAGFRQFLAQPQLKNASVGLIVIDSKDGRTIYEHNADRGFPTASTLKTITSITAFDLLGTDFHYTTQLFHSGSIDNNGTLHGDLIIRGTGDPTLGSDRYPTTKASLILNNWVDAVKKSGIRHIQGNLYIDDSLFEGFQVPATWPLRDIGNYYGAGVSAVNWKENKAGIVFTPKEVGQPTPIASMTDDLAPVKIINQITTGKIGSGDNVYGYSSPYADEIVLKGTYGKDLKKTIEVSVTDPAMVLKKNFAAALRSAGISYSESNIVNTKTRHQTNDIRLLHTHTSPSLAEIVKWFNTKSINLYGEALLKSLSIDQNGKYHNTLGITKLQQHWATTLQIPKSQLAILDGSGLSPTNRVTPSAMVKIVNYARSQPWFNAFHSSLPTINGMKMKSGTISNTLGYTGYQTASSGQQLTFVLLVHDYQGNTTEMRRQMFRFLDNLK